MKSLLRSALVLACSITACLGGPPSEMAEKYFGTMQAGEYAKTADFFDPGALKTFRELMNFADKLPEEESKEFYDSFFGPQSTKESVSALSDKEFFARFFAFIMKQADATFHKVEILGEVAEGDEVVHVLTRAHVSAGELKMTSLEVVSFTNRSGEWKALLSGELEGLAAQLEQAFTP